MRWQDPALSFTRPIRWLLALLDGQVVPVTASALVAGRTTRVPRAAAAPIVEVPDADAHADAHAAVLAEAGIITDQQLRREAIGTAACSLAAGAGGNVDLDAESGLLDQITFLVEEPTPILGSFDA